MLEGNKIYNMDCLEGMKLLDDNSVDSIVTDPPYELGFMGKKWDSTGIAYNVELWKECLRVLKPGGHLLAFGGTRTQHRMVCAIEDAGFEIREQIQWLYSQGFPKSHDISKAIDKKFGAEREVVGYSSNPNGNSQGYTGERYSEKRQTKFGIVQDQPLKTAPATPEAQQWDGWGTALKPANEPIVVARKPISEKTIAENVMKWGTGGINIDGCRIPTEDSLDGGAYAKNGTPRDDGWGMQRGGAGEYIQPTGRFPANVILDEEAGRMLDQQHKGASRFFYCAKASKKERNMGLEDVEPTTVDDGRNKPIDNPFLRGKTPRQNTHPTVKPIKLMEYLITLITPPNGIVLDPFMGSGTTAIACKQLGFDYIGFEKEKSYSKIIEGRVGEPPVTIEDKPSKKLKEDWLDDILAL